MRRSCQSGTALGVLLATLPLAFASEVRFKQYEIATDATARQTVLAGHLRQTALADLAVVRTDGGDRRLTVYSMEGDVWQPALHATLRPDVRFVDVGNIGGRDRLISCEAGRVNVFDADSRRERQLLALRSSFPALRANEIPHVDITHDINGDGRDDLVVLDKNGFWVVVQLEDGTFAEPLKVGAPPDLSAITGADGYRYDPWSQSRIHVLDYNGDERVDLIYWNGDRFAVHLQEPSGRFSDHGRTFITGVPFDTDRMISLADGKQVGRALHTIRDFNGDGVPDMAIYHLEGKRMAKKASHFAVHHGRREQGRLVFQEKAGSIFQSKGRIQIGMRFLEGGDLLLITSIKRDALRPSPWKSLKGFFGDDIGVDLEFYRWTERGYATTPNTVRGMGIDGAPSHREPGAISLDIVLRGATHEARKRQRKWPRAFNPNLFLGDVNGNGEADLIKETSFRGFKFYSGSTGPEVFSQEGQKVSVILPSDEEFAWLVDINRDGKQDILMHHLFTQRDIHGANVQPPGREVHRVVLMVTE